MSKIRITKALLLALSLAVALVPAKAQDAWMSRVEKTQAEQPHWITPLATTTPRLEQEFRYDLMWQQLGGGCTISNYGVGKGLELIPAERVEVILDVAPYLARNFPSTPDGFGDWPWLVKYRVASASEQHGNYIVTLFLGGTLPTGSHSNGAEHATLAPTLAYGKGRGNFDLQGTFGITVPVIDAARIGTPVGWNNAAQYCVLKKLWPEVEVNTTFFPNGARRGNKQVFVTPGLVIGKIPIHKRIGLTVGAGVQIAATRFHTSTHNVIVSVRIPF